MKKNHSFEVALVGIILILLGIILIVLNNRKQENTTVPEDPYKEVEKTVTEEEACPVMKEIYKEVHPTVDDSNLFCSFEESLEGRKYEILVRGNNEMIPIDTKELSREEVLKRVLERR